MTDVTDYIAYFRQLATEHVDIDDFYMMDINEPLIAMKNTAKYPMLILNQLSGGVMASNMDNTLDDIQGGFLIVDHLQNVDDFSSEMTILQDMKQIGWDVIARMLYDKQKCEPLAEKAIPGFDINTVRYEMLGPVFDNCFGFNFTFRLSASLDISYNAIKWDT
jgi:hypothetical protein